MQVLIIQRQRCALIVDEIATAMPLASSTSNTSNAGPSTRPISTDAPVGPDLISRIQTPESAAIVHAYLFDFIDRYDVEGADLDAPIDAVVPQQP